MTSGAIWGIVMLLYVLVGTIVADVWNDPPQPKSHWPDSLAVKQWKEGNDKRTKRRNIWCVGMVALLVIWYFTRAA
jgi:hypothetical protein